jgi:hypothetical protein
MDHLSWILAKVPVPMLILAFYKPCVWRVNPYLLLFELSFARHLLRTRNENHCDSAGFNWSSTGLNLAIKMKSVEFPEVDFLWLTIVEPIANVVKTKAVAIAQNANAAANAAIVQKKKEKAAPANKR